MANAHILVVDDEERIRQMLSTVLIDEDYTVSVAESGESAIKSLEKTVPDVILLDVWMPGMDGLTALQEIKKTHPDQLVIIISGHGTIETAVHATRLGAYDFIEKPLNIDKLLLTIERGLERQQLTQRYEVLREKLDANREIIGQSEPVQNLVSIIETAAPSNARVLISGENGTGKELVARAIHYLSPRHNAPFVEVNCAAIPEDLIESEMFGHEKGAFTSAVRMKKGKFELADKGTIFLDEIGDMSMKVQAKLLRVLQEQTIERVGGDRPIQVDVRVIAASNKLLPDLIEEGLFREDLYYRLNVLEVTVPPLRDRKEDIPLLAEHFLNQFAREYGKRPQKLSEATLTALRQHDWPGNIRELKNVIERLVILTSDLEIGPNQLPPIFHKDSRPAGGTDELVEFETLKEAREDFERRYVQHMLDKHEHNVTRTAEALGIERTNLHRKMKTLGMNSGE